MKFFKLRKLFGAVDQIPSRSHHTSSIFSAFELIALITLLFVTGCQRTDPATDTVPELDSEPVISAEKSTAGNQASSAARMQNASYVDDALCADCHREIYDSYQHVAMAKSFYDFDPAESIEDFDSNHFLHASSGNHYEMNVVDDQLQLTRYRLRADGTRTNEHKQSARYVVGSGNHVRTYLYRNDVGEMFQLPVVWYSQENKWGMAPGYDRPDHLDFSRPITRQCMFCHNAYPEFEPGSDAFGTPHHFPAKLPQGIGCQRCHGPGSEHVRISNEVDGDSKEGLKQIQNSIVNSARLSPQLQDDVCNQCHFQPMSQRTSIVRKFGTRDYEYQPGQSLTDYVIHFEPDRNNDLANHFEINHHPYRLYQSSCFLKTPGGIRCTDCHDPHVKIQKEVQSEYYRAKCFSCHESDDCLDIKNGRKPDANCIVCHMRQRRTTDVVNVTMTDHKISRQSRQDDPTAALNEIDVPINMPIRHYVFGNKSLSEEKRTQYELFLRSLDDDESALSLLEAATTEAKNAALECSLQLAQMQLQYRQYEQAEQTLNSIDQQYHRLPLFQTNRGVSALGRKQNDVAVDRLTRAATNQPKSAPAWYNLGIAQSRQEQHEAAIRSLEMAIKLRPNYAKAYNKLGSVFAINDRFDEAAIQFDTAIKLNANDLDSYRKLSAVLRREGDFGLAIDYLNDATRFAPNDTTLQTDLALTLLDSANRNERDSQRALEIANRLVSTEGSMDAAIIRTLALIDVDQPTDALAFINEKLQGNFRKPEAGLLMAIGQQKLESREAANQNFAGAKQAIQRTKMDRIARVVLEYAEQHFKNNVETDNQD